MSYVQLTPRHTISSRLAWSLLRAIDEADIPLCDHLAKDWPGTATWLFGQPEIQCADCLAAPWLTLAAFDRPCQACDLPQDEDRDYCVLPAGVINVAARMCASCRTPRGVVPSYDAANVEETAARHVAWRLDIQRQGLVG